MGRLLRNPGFWFWFVMGFLLILGVVTWVIDALVLKPDAASFIRWMLGLSIWAGALALCALLLRGIISCAPYLLRALAAMWRPLVLVLALPIFCSQMTRDANL